MFQISFSKLLRYLFVSKSKAACAQFIRAEFLQRIAREHTHLVAMSQLQ